MSTKKRGRERQLGVEDYKIGWICALPVEFAAAVAMLDERHPELQHDEFDTNTYQFGAIEHVNVIITALPSGVYGTVSAAKVATHLQRSFPELKYCLMVGIGGGVPHISGDDIRLGDVVVSHPVPGYGGVLQYDFGKTVQEGRFVQTGVLNKPPSIFLQAITKLKADYLLDSYATFECIIADTFKDENFSQDFSRPPPESDRLFVSYYDHPLQNESCDQCDRSMVAERAPRVHKPDQPHIHYGLIASGNQVMKHGKTRDKLGEENNVLCFEMEAAGLMDELPCLVIRGICDYSDSHKNKNWQKYAALVAAAYAKALLCRLPRIESEDANSRNFRRKLELNPDAPSDETKQAINKCLQNLGATNPQDDRTRIEKSKDELIKESYSWILSDQGFESWLSDTLQKPVLWISGDPGKGKTMIFMGIVDFLKENQKLAMTQQPVAISYFFCQAADERLNCSTGIIKGLLRQLMEDDPTRGLYKYVEEEFEKCGSSSFTGKNAAVALSRVLSAICSDPMRPELYLLVDALDECEEGLNDLFDLISQTASSKEPKIRWLVTSRNRSDIEEPLDNLDSLHRIRLETNVSYIASSVDAYIEKKVTDLAKAKRYGMPLKEEVIRALHNKAGSTFLWVHLVCKELATLRKNYQVIPRLQEIPSGLSEVYYSMLAQIEKSCSNEDFSICSKILLAVVAARVPLRLSELPIVAETPKEMDEQDLEQQVKECGSFLFVENETVFLVHQSAKDFLECQIDEVVKPKARNTRQPLVFSPDGRQIACPVDGGLCLWDFDLKATLSVRMLSGNSVDIASLVFSPNGDFLVSTSNNGTAELWDAASGDSLGILTYKATNSEETYPLSSLAAFSPNGDLAIGCQDHRVRLWKRPLRTFQ
ncbi:hypothetical protein ABW19_dt0206190 [Dactylella cylindrospora]|nr:hypothetical protein ABW19_dt0206190 [Dactylella cylindrospora]